MLLNEPHDPQAECGVAIPPQTLYAAAKEIRTAHNSRGVRLDDKKKAKKATTTITVIKSGGILTSLTLNLFKKYFLT